MSDAQIRQLERIPVGKMTYEQVLALGNLYTRLGRNQDVERLWFAYRQSLPPLPITVRQDRQDQRTLICYFLTVPGSTKNWWEVEAYSNLTGSFSADYNWEVQNTTPTRKDDPRVVRFVQHLENLDGRRCKIYQKNSYKFDQERKKAWEERR
jgi:hypothetical protein